MMKVKDRKLTEKECINSGGHFLEILGFYTRN